VLNKLYNYTILTQRWKANMDKWAQDNSGSAAVEFALIATPFLFLLTGLLEVSLIFIVTTTLEHGINEASRDIRTGSLQNAGLILTRADFVESVCDELFGLLSCEDNLDVDVRAFTAFTGANLSNGIDDNGNYSNLDFQFQPGVRNDIVLARVYYEWNLITPGFSAPLENLTNGNRLITAAVAFRNEPF